jgi:drug/metabolite transporter (DMT)-like permease
MQKKNFFANFIAVLLALASAFLFGAATPASKALLSSVQPLQLAGLIGLGSVLVALPLTLLTDRVVPPWRLAAEDRWRLFASLGLGGTLGPVLLLAGLHLASAGSVSMWLNLELIFTAILAATFFGERLGWLGWVAVGGAMVAACLLSLGEGLAGWAAGALVAGACFCWGVDNNCTATIKSIGAPQIVLWKGLVSGIVNTSLAFVCRDYVLEVHSIGFGLLVGMVSYGASIMLYIIAAHSLGTVRTQTLFSTAPFWGLALAYLFLQETVSGIQLFAAASLIASLALLAFDKKKKTTPALSAG